MNMKAFTLVELTVVAIIVGLLALVAIPNMIRSVNRGYAKDAMRNLMAIYATEQDYAQNHNGSYWNNGTNNCDINCINGGLQLNIIPTSGMTYNLPNSLPVVVWARRSVTSPALLITFNNPINTLEPVYCDPSDLAVPLVYNPCCFDTNPSTLAGQPCDL